MDHIEIAQGSYAKFKVTATGEDFPAAEQVHAFIYNEKSQILKSFSRDAQSGYTTYTPGAEADNILIEILPADTKNVKPGKFFIDIQKFVDIDGTNQPLMNPSFNDDNILFILKESIAKDKPIA